MIVEELDNKDKGEDENEDDPLASAEFDSPSPLATATARTRSKQKPATMMMTGPPRQSQNRGSALTVQSGGAPSKARRQRLTLDEELRNSNGVTKDDLRALDIEPHMLTAVGWRHQNGFLAHGGGAGAPILVGVEGHAFDNIAHNGLKQECLQVHRQHTGSPHRQLRSCGPHSSSERRRV